MSGTYNYTVTLTGGCGTATATGTITVNPNNTITLSSGSSTDNQTICVNKNIASIVYSISGATGASVSGLPLGVTYSFNSGVLMISGTPTVSGTYNYTVTLTGGCGNVTGRITVRPNSTITLLSPSGTDNQNVCRDNNMTSIVYNVTEVSGVSVIGLPPGVTYSFNSGLLIISGTPTVSRTYNYKVNLIGGCGTATATGTIIVDICNGIQTASAPASWKVYPNPNKGIFFIHSEKPAIFELMDITGKHINTYRTQGTALQVNENLPAGMYFVREKETGLTQKIIVE